MTVAEREVRERPILMRSDLVTATREGRKTQTRRVVHEQLGKFAWIENVQDEWFWFWDVDRGDGQVDQDCKQITCPYGMPGDRLWIRERWRVDYAEQDIEYADGTRTRHLDQEKWFATEYQNDRLRNRKFDRWRPSIHMPRFAARILLEIEDVRAERVQDISEADAEAEGVVDWPHYYDCVHRQYQNGVDEPGCNCGSFSHIETFARLWDSINAKRGFGWDVNLWVWAVTYKLIEDRTR